jgi:putative tryptophan/tyrosine transport system substrate-binding protein
MKKNSSIKLILFGLLLGSVISIPTGVARSSEVIIASVFSYDHPRYRNAHKGFMRSIASKGYVPGSAEFIVQIPNPDPISWSNAIRKASAIGANVIVTYGSPATLAALQETKDIPIVFVDVYSPLEAGIAKSLATPGNNATGVSSKVPLPTLVKTAMEFKHFRQIGVLYCSREIGSLIQLKEMKRLAMQYGFSVVEANVANVALLDSALITLATQVDCVYITEASTVGRQMDKIIHWATEKKIPVITQVPDGGEKGALISLEAHPEDMGQQAADVVVRVLSGKKAALLPILAPKKIDLVINMKTARALELHVPLQVLNMATRIIK